MDINLEELERLAAQATPGPWEVDDCNNIRIAPKGRPIVATIHDYEDYLPRMADAQYIVAACNGVPELVTRVRELERQRDFVLMHRIPSECLSPKDCVYLAGESPDWRCTAKLEKRKKCLEKAVARAEGETGKTADVDAEKAAKEAGE